MTAMWTDNAESPNSIVTSDALNAQLTNNIREQNLNVFHPIKRYVTMDATWPHQFLDYGNFS